MQVTLKQDGFLIWQRAFVGLFALFLVTSTGCERLGTAVSKYLPAKSKQVADKAADATSETDQSDESPAQNLGGNSSGGDLGAASGDPSGDNLQNYGPETGDAFDPANDDPLASEVDASPQTDPLAETDTFEGPSGQVDEFTGGSVVDPATEPTGDPGLTTSGGEVFDPATAPQGEPGLTPPNSAGQSNQRPSRQRPAGSTGSRPGRKTRPTANKANGNAGARNTNTNPNNARVEEPQGKPIMRLIANAAVPAQTTEGQRIGFSVEYQLQRSGLTPNGEYGLLIESAKNGRYGMAVQLREEGTLQVAAVPQFRPTSGPFKAYLVQRTKSGMQRISNIVQFKTLY